MDSLSDHRGTASGNSCFGLLFRQKSTYEEVPVVRYVHPTRSRSLSVLRQRSRPLIPGQSTILFPLFRAIRFRRGGQIAEVILIQRHRNYIDRRMGLDPST